MHRSRRAVALVAGTVLAVILAACGSDSDTASPGTGSPAATSDASLAALKESVSKYLTPPTSIVQSTPLKSAPPKKKVAFVQCADPSCAVLAGFFKEASSALGWETVSLSATATDPGAAIQQAIDAGVDYIATTGFTMDLFKQQASQAKEKKIPLFLCYSTDVPAGADNNLYSDCNDTSASQTYARVLADYLTVDSNGKADILQVSIPSYPILNAQSDAVRAQLGKNCPGCKFRTLDVSVNDLAGGAVPQKVSSFLQANPSVNYVFFTYSTLSTGVAPALKSAGLLDKVKLVGTQAGQPQLTEIVNGNSHAWSALPLELSMWTLVDQIARLSVNEWSPTDERKAAISPFYLVTTPDAAKAIVNEKYGWPGPAGFKDMFKKLWGV